MDGVSEGNDSLALEELLLDGNDRRFCAVAGAQFGEDLADVVAHSGGAEKERFGNGLIGLALHQQAENVAFSLG